jgi:hypothetical protein
VLSGLIRQIERSSDAEVAYDTALDFAVTCGFGYFRINTRYASDDSFDQDLTIERVANPFSIYGDPEGTAADSSDWNVAFVVDSLPRAAFEARWKGAQAVDWGADGSGADSAAARRAAGPEGERVVVAEYWTREPAARQVVALSDGQVVELAVYEAQKAMFDALGVRVSAGPRTVASHKVTQRILSGAEVLERIDWAGKFIPIVPVWGEELHVDGRRRLRSLVRDAKDPQRMFNYWRTTTTELVALAPKTPFIGRKGAFETDSAKWATANTESHAYIEYDGPEAPQRQPFAGPPAGAMQEALSASDDMKAIMGLHDASLGAASNETSGRAILVRQREGDVSSFHFIDNLGRSLRHGGRVLLDLIPKVYGAARVVRILGADGAAQSVRVNPPGQTGPQAGPSTGAPEGVLAAAERIYDLSLGKYDVSIESGPSFSTRREEAANQMIELIRAYPQAAPVLGDLLAKNLDWPGADEIAQRLAALLPPQARGGSPDAQALQAAQGELARLGEALAAARAHIAALKQDQANAARRLQIEAFEAETQRLKALRP